ncbi:GrpB domain, predicted nucleotidyltransferase, UPF0157 family [Paenibacillus sp. 1_12]|uniref:GrpB family protein n=1 Tax=Paenibacillus sp. 1_12 TaxID=1566278 RepID=UPI0008E41699|nr:GrpB family protein [Paenibacillus sp. 1_12]SFL60776.1 GrpB domain, predicted nucleotidyltransferase, UPF0157 family [Paenibacillus sp. 1_12]
MRRVEVLPYDEKWSILFKEEAAKIKTVYGDKILNIHHIGSTAIPSVYAKPIIDIMVVVKDISKVDSFNYEMQLLGYTPKGENGIPERRYFNKGGNARTHHLHAFQTGNENILRHLAFRDYLNEFPDKAKMYSELKLKLSKEFPTDITNYIDGKNALVKELDLMALKWYSEK